MNTRLGKSFGLAFVVAVGIIAVMVAMGTFSVQKAGADVTDGSVELSLTNQNPDAHTGVTVSFTDTDALAGTDAIEITFAGLTLDNDAASFNEKVTVTGPVSGGGTYAYMVPNGEATVAGLVLTLQLPADTETDIDEETTGDQVFVAGTYTVVIEAGAVTEDDSADVIKTSDMATEATATVVTDDTNQGDGISSEAVQIYDPDVLSSQDAGAGVSVTIEFTTTADIPAGDDVIIDLTDYGVPSSIDADSISIKGPLNGTSATADAADATVSGSKITIEIPDMDGTGTVNDLGDGAVTIRIRSRAGIENPTMSGDGYVIKVTHDGADLYERDPGTINATLKVAPTSGLAGEELTVSGVGYTNGTATIYHVGMAPAVTIDGETTPAYPAVAPAPGSDDSPPPGLTKVGAATASGGSFSTTIEAGDVFTAAGNDLIARGSTGQWGPTDDFTLNGSISIAESVTKGTDLTVKVSKWSKGAITRVTINGEAMETSGDLDPTDNNGASEFKVTVGAGALLGDQTLVLYTADGSAGQKNINIVGIDLTVSPSTAVVGQEVTVTGSGFTDGGAITSLSIGGVNVLLQVSDKAIASGGRVVAAFRIPNDDARLKDAKDYSISLGDGTRTGSATVTIPAPTLTVDPMESRIGTTIDLSGTNWPTGTGANLVSIHYDGIQYSTAIANSDGTWSASIAVPDDADVGETHPVAAKATVGGAADKDNVTKSVDHSTPDAVVTLSSSTAQRGTTITVSGDNFHVFETVAIDIGTSIVTPSPAPTTDGDGSFSADVLVPGLALGNKNVKVVVKRRYEDRIPGDRSDPGRHNHAQRGGVRTSGHGGRPDRGLALRQRHQGLVLLRPQAGRSRPPLTSPWSPAATTSGFRSRPTWTSRARP